MQEYPWRLKLVHEGFRCIRVERPGRFLSFEPEEAFHEVGLFLGGDEERLRGLHATANNGGGEVLLPEFLQKQLGEMGGIEMHAYPTELDGIKFDSMTYQPQMQPDRESGVLRMRQAMRNPRKTARRLMEGGEESRTVGQASILQLTFPDGGRLLHLDLSLHNDVDLKWLAEAQSKFDGADWVICGVEFGQDAAVLEHLSGFNAEIHMIADLVNEERVQRGLPTNLLTPTVDALVDQGLKAYPFPPKSSFRFES